MLALAKYNNEVLSEMCSKVNLLDYVSNTHEIRTVGGKHYIKCPVHQNDDTPSMIINPDTNKYYCFSCMAKGGWIDWATKVEHLSWNEAITKLMKLSGMENVQLKQCEALAFYKQAKKIYEMSCRQDKIDRSVLPSNYMNQFSDDIPQEWVDEGISVEAIKKYEIKIDHKSNRIVYPVYDNDFRLIGAKGRTRFPGFKELKISKYMNYFPIGTVDYFMGMKQNKKHLLLDKKAIVFEGLKSVMKLDDWNEHHALAAETSCLNDAQVRILIEMGLSDITIAFDKGIELSKIKKCTEKLRRFTNVYAIVDKHNLLNDKDAPVDRGKEIWERLFSERVKL